MNLLVIGGSRFVGRAIVEVALLRGHTVSMFNRGESDPDLFPEVEKLRGNRDGELQALEGRSWDAVIDTCGYVPRVVGQSVELLKGAVPHYTFISTISVYADGSGATIDEDSPVATMEDETVEEVTGESYGALKVLCEKVVQEAYGDKALIIRPGLVVGPWDRSDRFTYWPVRIADGGDVLVPDLLDQPAQFIDVRDLAEFTVLMAQKRAAGVYNATGPGEPLTMGDLFETCKAVANPSANLVPVDTRVLVEHKVEPWSDLPVVLPYDRSSDAMSRTDISRAQSEGLTHRPLAQTIADTLAWFSVNRPEGPLKAGLSREREAEVLEAARVATP